MTQKSYMHTYILYIHSYVDMMCIYIYIAESTIYIQVVMFIHDIDMYIYIYVHMCVSMPMYINVYVYYTYIYMYIVYIFVYIYTHVCSRYVYDMCCFHTYLHTYFHIYIHILSMHPITWVGSSEQGGGKKTKGIAEQCNGKAHGKPAGTICAPWSQSSPRNICRVKVIWWVRGRCGFEEWEAGILNTKIVRPGQKRGWSSFTRWCPASQKNKSWFTNHLNIDIWGWVKTLVPSGPSEHQNSW